MGLVIVLLAFIGPRVALLFTWIFTNLVDRAFAGFLLPLVGLIVLPWTTLVYVIVWRPEGLAVLGWIVVAVAFVADLTSYGYGQRRTSART